MLLMIDSLDHWLGAISLFLGLLLGRTRGLPVGCDFDRRGFLLLAERHEYLVDLLPRLQYLILSEHQVDCVVPRCGLGVNRSFLRHFLRRRNPSG